MRHLFIALVWLCFFALSGTAQIGYQVALLNNATGEPRANERVSVTIKITDSKGNTLCEETKDEVSNDFGVLSMSVGNGETFAKANWGNFPFFIEATVDGRTLGKSQLLSVPVAEYAKKTGILTKEILMSRVWNSGNKSGSTLVFNDNNVYFRRSDGSTKYVHKYLIDGNYVIIYEGYYIEYEEPTGERGYFFYDGENLIPINTMS